MNISQKEIDAVNTVVTIKVTPDDYQEKVEKSLKDYRKKINMPGFRPGMVPVGLVKKMYGKAILAEEINKIISDALNKYIADNKIEILGEPLPNEEQQKEVDFELGNDFEFEFNLGLAPKFDTELDKKLKIPYYDIEVTDQMVDNQIKEYASRFGSYEKVDDYQGNDMLKGLLVELDENSQPKENGIKIEDAVMSPEYMKNEIQETLFKNAKIGDTITFAPKTAFENEAEIASLLKIKKEEVANMDSNFSFEIKEITRYVESPLDQTLFDKIFGKNQVESFDEFKVKVADGLKEAYKNDSDYKFGLDAKEALVKTLENVQFPDAFLKHWLLSTDQKLTKEDLDKNYGKMLDDLKWYLISNKIAEQNQVKVEKEDLDAFAKKAAKIQFAQYGMSNVPENIIDSYVKEMLNKEETVKSFYNQALNEKIVEVIKNAITLTHKKISIEDFNKMFK